MSTPIRTNIRTLILHVDSLISRCETLNVFWRNFNGIGDTKTFSLQCKWAKGSKIYSWEGTASNIKINGCASSKTQAPLSNSLSVLILALFVLLQFLHGVLSTCRRLVFRMLQNTYNRITIITKRRRKRFFFICFSLSWVEINNHNSQVSSIFSLPHFHFCCDDYEIRWNAEVCRL